MGITSYIYYTFSRPLFFVSQSDNLSLPFHCRLPSFFLEMPAQYFLCTYICMYILLFSILSSRFSVLRTSYLSFCLCLSPFLFSYSPILLFSFLYIYSSCLFSYLFSCSSVCVFPALSLHLYLSLFPLTFYSIYQRTHTELLHF